jgi:hypothetical protein
MIVSIQCILLAGISSLASAQTSAREKMREIDRQRHEVERKLRDEMRKIEQSDALAGLRKNVEQCEKAYREKVENHPGIIATRKAADKARDDLRETVDKKLANDPGAKKDRANIEKMENQRMDLEHQRNLTRLRLTDQYSPVQRELRKDRNLQEMKRKMYGLEKSEDRIKAMREHREAQKAALEKMPEAKILLGEIMQIEGRIQMIEKKMREARGKADETRRAMEKSDDPAIARARKRYEDARKASYKAYEAGELQAARKKGLDARKAMRAKVEEIASKNPGCRPLIRKIEELKKKRDELRR